MQTPESMYPLRQIITGTCARYVAITPRGIVLPYSPNPYNPLPVTIVAYSPARTRYVNRHPICRSLNGINSINGRGRCMSCEEKQGCTPQIALEILYRSVPFRIMLSYTSAKNFIAFCKTCRPARQYVEGALIEISIVNRGSWGEACFAVAKNGGTL